VVDTTPGAVCEDLVIFIIKTATNMMATDGNIDGFPVQRAILAKDTDHAKIHHPKLCQEHSKVMPIL
jgi:hypothetical protein